MAYAVLWIDILSFAILLAGLGAEFLAFDLLVLVQALAIFDRDYIPSRSPSFLAFAAYFRTAASLVILGAFPLCVARASGMRTGIGAGLRTTT